MFDKRTWASLSVVIVLALLFFPGGNATAADKDYSQNNWLSLVTTLYNVDEIRSVASFDGRISYWKRTYIGSSEWVFCTADKPNFTPNCDHAKISALGGLSTQVVSSPVDRNRVAMILTFYPGRAQSVRVFNTNTDKYEATYGVPVGQYVVDLDWGVAWTGTEQIAFKSLENVPNGDDIYFWTPPNAPYKANGLAAEYLGWRMIDTYQLRNGVQVAEYLEIKHSTDPSKGATIVGTDSVVYHPYLNDVVLDDTYGVKLSPNGDLVAHTRFHAFDGIWLYNTRSRTTKHLVQTSIFDYLVTQDSYGFSPDSTKLSYVKHFSDDLKWLTVVDTATGETIASQFLGTYGYFESEWVDEQHILVSSPLVNQYKIYKLNQDEEPYKPFVK